MQRLFAAALIAAALLPVSVARAGWWQDVRAAKHGITTALRQQWITRDEAAGYRSVLTRATGEWRRLGGSRSENLAAVLHDVARERQAYVAPRALALFSMLDVNARYLGSDSLPPARSDVLDADGVVYRSFPGQGLQFHPLGNFARLDSLLARGDESDAATLAAALIARAVPRAGSLLWEYYFPFGGGSPPWTSGMAQAVAARALAAAGDLPEARRAFLALSRLTFPLGGGVWVRLYSFTNDAVLNAQLQTVLSLADYGTLNYDRGAAALSARLLRTADALFPRFDTGAWSRYELFGGESDLHYHLYVVDLLQRIAATSGADPRWALRAERFARYTTEPPDVGVHVSPRPVRASATIQIWVSKLSSVRLAVGRRARSFTFARGLHTVYWSARALRPGRYAVHVSAVDQAGNRGTADGRPLVVARRRR
jgi:hypothetical protein